MLQMLTTGLILSEKLCMKALYPLIAPLGSGSTIPHEHTTPEYPFPSTSPPSFSLGLDLPLATGA